MKRIAVILLLIAATAALLVSGSAAGGDDGTYEVRAIFDNAGFLVTGEEVRVAGAKVGSVTAVDVTGSDEAATEDGSPEPGKAVVVMQIDDPGFQDFRRDASCLIRPQSLIGEKFVECKPTQPRGADSIEPPALEQIADGEPGEGQYLLPLERNGKAVDLDLVNNILKEPYPDRFRLILNDLGAGLAARGDDLAEIVQRSNPALRETNQVLAILAHQNHALSNLASDSDQILSALARKRENVVGFINSATVAGEATAERRQDLEASFAKLPGFLRELRSTMTELDRFSSAATPVFSDLGDAAPSLTRLSRATGPFSNAGTAAITSLGTASEQAGPPLAASDPVIRQIGALASKGGPATENLAKLLTSLRKTRGFEYLLKTVFGASGAVNGFDSYGHFLRALIPINNCFDYTSIPQNGCNARFVAAGLSSPAAKKKAKRKKAVHGALKALQDALVPGAQGPTGHRGVGEPRRPSVETAPEATTPPATGEPAPPADSSPQVTPDASAAGSARSMRAARGLLDFLIGEPRGQRGGKP